MRPSELINDCFLYCLAAAMMHAHVEVYAVCVLSNHYHIVVKDTKARLPEFLAYLNMFVSKCVNATLDRCENVWASEPPSAVALTDDEDVLEKMVYTLVNPVAAHLVAQGKDWPGVRSTSAQWLKPPEEVARPAVFFRADGEMPKTVELRLTRPPIFQDMSDEGLAAEFQRKVLEREAEERREHRLRGGRFLGRKKVLAQSPFGRPRKYEPRRTINPRVAGHDKWRKLEALRRIKRFYTDYRESLVDWKAGKPDVVFPAGTYALRVNAGVICASP